MGPRHRHDTDRAEHGRLFEMLLALRDHEEQPRQGVGDEHVVPAFGRGEGGVAEARLGGLEVAGPFLKPAPPEPGLGVEGRVGDRLRLHQERRGERQALAVLAGGIQRLQPVDAGLESRDLGAHRRILGGRTRAVSASVSAQ